MIKALKDSIRSALAEIGTSAPILKQPGVAPKLYEIFVFACVLRALNRMSATLTPRDKTDKDTSTLIFRMGPGTLAAPASAPGFVLIQYGGREYELQTDLRVAGSSKVLHELDVCILERQEAQRCRNTGKDPKVGSVRLLVECKFYGDTIPLGVGREYLGLRDEFYPSKRGKTLVTNVDNPEIRLLLRQHNCTGNPRVIPGAAATESFIGWLEVELKQLL
jgi:hypothetical protein